ncbi:MULTISPECIES: DUF6684 family protein [Halorussus]|uniref:DUF6684 family protein n=1 Tax=Halorussus aquaticus TaxID=2953748 RepID=A0ABD5PYI7_9EURY|nr:MULTISPECIES: DUF6684 family protein [Halorussus]NEU56652.1 hypothetical protein [Halorussus sp. MSC15.2]
MATPIFDRETWLDISVNIIPLCIIGFFVVLFTVASPWAIEGLTSSIGFALLVVPFALLAYLTYFSAKLIEDAESE